MPRVNFFTVPVTPHTDIMVGVVVSIKLSNGNDALFAFKTDVNKLACYLNFHLENRNDEESIRKIVEVVDEAFLYKHSNFQTKCDLLLNFIVTTDSVLMIMDTTPDESIGIYISLDVADYTNYTVNITPLDMMEEFYKLIS